MMSGKSNNWVVWGALTTLLLCSATNAGARGGQSQQSQPGQQGQQTPPPQQTPATPDKDKQPNPAPLSMDSAAPSPEEESVYKAEQGATDNNKKTQMAEDFLQKYPQSRY